jgi:RIO kinase 2
MYLSRLAAQKEWEVMRVLHREGFRVPEPIAWSRHTVVMEFVDAFPLRMVESVPEPGKLYAELIDMIIALAKRGLIHGDFNEFNILIKEEEKAGKVKAVPVLIDFPQIVSTNHANAQTYFDRDIACVKRYFERRFKYVADEDVPSFVEAVKGIEHDQRLDIEIEASGFSKKMARDLEQVVGFDADADTDASSKQEDGSDAEDNAEVEEESDGDVDEDNELQNEQEGNERLEDDMRQLDLGGDYAVKPVRASDYGLVPLDLAQDPDVVAEKIHSKKKAGGWAI